MGLQRSMKRKILRSKKMSTSELTKRVETVQEHIMSASISMSINILSEKYGWSYEQLCDMANAIVDEYEKIDDFDLYAVEVFNRTGVGVLRTEEAERMENGR